MVTIEFEMKGKKNEKKFKSHQKAKEFLVAKGYEFDEINHYYWKLEIMFGWMMKAKLIKS